MAEFDYRAYAADGGETTGTISATDASHARGQLREKGLFPRDLTPADGSAAPASVAKRGTLSAAALTDWATRMAAMLAGGLPLDKALKIVCDPAGRDPVTRTSQHMLEALQSGASPAEAAAKTNAFDSGVLGLLRAADSTGDLAAAFAAIARDGGAALARRRTIVAALTYPVLLLGFAAVALTFMLLVIIPRFQPIFAQARAEVPAGTQRILAASAWLQDHALVFGVCVAAVLLVVVFAGRNGHLVSIIAPFARRLPGVSGLYTKLNRVQVLDRLAGFLDAGVALPEALSLTAGSASDARFRAALLDVRSRVTVGETFGNALAAQGVMSPQTLALVRTGEESGALQQMLALAASTQDAEAQATLKRLLSVVEPLLILVIGAVIGGMILSIFQAVLSINDVVI